MLTALLKICPYPWAKVHTLKLQLAIKALYLGPKSPSPFSLSEELRVLTCVT